MYYIHDLYADVWESFASREDAAAWWKSNFTDFCDLNVTGKDCFAETELDGFETDDDGFVHPVFYRYGPVLRRYQVFDEDFRSIDIRLWPDSVWNAEPHRCSWPRPWLWNAGYKHRRPGITAPSMAYSTSRQNADCVDYEELYEDGLPAPERDRSAVRPKVLISDFDTWDHMDKSWSGFRSSRCSKSWKDQHKSRRQWGKHKSVPRVPQEIPENGEDLAARLTAEIVLKEYCENI